MSDQILWDCHMHSSFSVDSSTPMEDMVLKSIQQGLTGICFTEHLDPDYPDTPEKIDFSLDIPAYHKQLQTLREKYKDKLDIYKVDVDQEEELESAFKIRTIPNLLLCPVNGKPIMKLGTMNKVQLKELIEATLFS